MGEEPLLSSVAASLGAFGLGPVHAFDTAWWRGRPGLGAPGRLAFLVASGREIWSALPSARPSCSDPVDDHVTRALETVAGAHALEVAVLAHREPPFPIARLAHDVGFGELGPAHLLVHPERGPWVALRGVLVSDRSPSNLVARSRPSPCARCPAPCARALEAALDGATSPTRSLVRRSWRSWLRVRDVCPVGREHRPSDAQLRYHYLQEGWPGGDCRR